MTTSGSAENFLPTFYATSSVNSGLPPMPFPYLSTGIADTWSTSSGSLFPNANGAFSASVLPEQMLQPNTAVGNASYLNGLDHVPNSGISNNIAYLNQQALFFPGNTTDLSWGGQPQTSSGSILGDFYQPQAPPVLDNTAAQVEVDHKGVENSLAGLTLSQKLEDPLNGDSQQNGSVNSAPPSSGGPPKPKSWAAIASQPAKPKPPTPKIKPVQLGVNSGNRGDTSTWNGSNASVKTAKQGNARTGQQRNRAGGTAGLSNISSPGQPVVPVLERLRLINDYNPKEFSLRLKDVRFFIIKSYSEDDIHRSIKYSVWTSTEHGNRRLNDSFREQQRSGKGPMYLLFSVNGSGHFCGVAEMKSEVEYDIETGIWSQEKWKGKFAVKWYYVKDVPNNALRHIRLENNDNKPVTNSRDTQEVPPDKGIQVVKIIHSFKNQTSIFDDFGHYEKRQEEEIKSKVCDSNGCS